MTLFEWRITDKATEITATFGISEPNPEVPNDHLHVWIDARNLFGHFDYWNKRESNMLANCEQPKAWYAYKLNIETLSE